MNNYDFGKQEADGWLAVLGFVCVGALVALVALAAYANCQCAC